LFADFYTKICPEAGKTQPGTLSCIFLQTAYIGKNLLLLLEGQFTKLLKHLLFDGHPLASMALYRAWQAFGWAARLPNCLH